MVKKSDSLEEYKSKRDLSKSGEPEAKKLSKSKSKSLKFVIQFHKASHDHYDLRLEKDGVLKSWAVPKEPSTDPKIKRLAIQVEDHPLEYGNFHGEIKEGYGKGTVKIWDKGSYTIKDWDDKKKIEINIKGERLNGMYALVKTNYGNKPEKSWLFFKMKGE
jgi:DNA ligase D-like protein (predicted 3'-phosphoesterase)